MKVITLRSPAALDNLQLIDGAAPGEPGPGEVRVRVHASSLNFHDYAVAVGILPAADGRIPMSDGAGVVEAVGAGVAEFKVGDHVVSCFFPGWLDGEPTVSDFATTPGDGVDGYAREWIVKPAHWFTHAPAGYSHAEAATLTTAGLTAWRALMADDSLKPGDTVLVQGTGGVSIFALQFAKMAGATVIATSSSDEKLERLKAMGADHVINYRKDSQWGATALALTGGRGVDHIIEVGGPATLEQSMIAIRVGGHISIIGILSGVTGAMDFVPMLIKQVRLQGVLVGSRSQQQAMIRAIDANGMRPVIDRHFPLTDIVEAFKYQETNQHFGKIILDI